MRTLARALPLVLLLLCLPADEEAGAWCNTPKPALPGRGGPGGGGPGGPGGPSTPGGRGAGALTGFPGLAGSWRVWWDFNREHLLGLRGAAGVEASGGEGDSAVDPVGPLWVRVRGVLRAVAASGAHEEIRAAALRALGRAGSPEDAELLVRILRTPQQPSQVVEGAAVALASLPRLRRDEDRQAVRAVLDAVLAERLRMSGRTRLLAVMVLGLRGRSDPALVRALVARLEGPGLDPEEAASVLFGAGLTRTDFPVPVLLEVVESGKLGKRSLHDVARSYGVLALALAGERRGPPALARLLETRNTPAHTRRSAALALGHLLREGAVDDDTRAALGPTLARVMQEDPDPLVAGWCAIAYGFAREPYPTAPLRRLLSRGSGATMPYAALALGLSARNAAPEGAASLRELLLEAYGKARGVELPGALAIALGLARAEEGRELLAGHVASPWVSAAQRGPACQALGMLGGEDERSERALLVALNDSSDEVAQNAALGLGLRGGPRAAAVLVEMLAATRSELMQAHMVTGLSHAGGREIVSSLLALLSDPSRKRDVRVSAATALGLLLSPDGHDLLFEVDAYSNPYGLTEAGRELVRIF